MNAVVQFLIFLVMFLLGFVIRMAVPVGYEDPVHYVILLMLGLSAALLMFMGRFRGDAEIPSEDSVISHIIAVFLIAAVAGALVYEFLH